MIEIPMLEKTGGHARETTAVVDPNRRRIGEQIAKRKGEPSFVVAVPTKMIVMRNVTRPIKSGEARTLILEELRRARLSHASVSGSMEAEWKVYSKKTALCHIFVVNLPFRT